MEALDVHVGLLIGVVGNQGAFRYPDVMRHPRRTPRLHARPALPGKDFTGSFILRCD